jgi:hypothetical protein
VHLQHAQQAVGSMAVAMLNKHNQQWAAWPLRCWVSTTSSGQHGHNHAGYLLEPITASVLVRHRGPVASHGMRAHCGKQLLTSHRSVCPGTSWPDAGTTANGSCSFQLKCSPASPTFLIGSCRMQLCRTGTQPKSTAEGRCSLLAGSTADRGTMMLLEPVISSSSSVYDWRVLGRKATCMAASCNQEHELLCWPLLHAYCSYPPMTWSALQASCAIHAVSQLILGPAAAELCCRLAVWLPVLPAASADGR